MEEIRLGHAQILYLNTYRMRPFAFVLKSLGIEGEEPVPAPNA
jgi:hypothetical protein